MSLFDDTDSQSTKIRFTRHVRDPGEVTAIYFREHFLKDRHN
jgi:hypothetical protein